ncbi:hypothetical protein ACF0H5_003716 [Mactra antiquata]
MASGGLLNTSEETFDFVCTACELDNKTLEAVKYCIECQGYCCLACTDTHRKFPTLRSHNLLDVSQGNPGSNQPPSLPEFPTERCCTHKGKVVDMYCQSHDVVGCSTCISKDHRSCPDSHIHYIPDMIGSLFNLSDSKVIQNQLKQLIASMTALGKSKDEQLEALNVAKDEAVQKIEIFQMALVAAIKKAADLSKKEVNDVYKKLEKEILQDKSAIDKTSDVLKVTHGKLNKSEANRAQRFVCTKIAKEKITQAESDMAEKEKSNIDVIQMSFTPNQSLKDNIIGLQGIGQVGVPIKKKTDLYKITGSKDINIKVSDDRFWCYSLDCCLTDDNQLLATDQNNKKLKRIDTGTLRVIDYCKFDSEVFGVCCVSKQEAVVACGHSNMIQFVSIGETMIPTRQIKMSHCCYGINTMNGKLYVTDAKCSLYVYDMTGNLLNTISHDNAGNSLFSCGRLVTFNEKNHNLYVCDRDKGVVCFDNVGNYLSTVNDYNLKYVHSVCVDGRSNMFVVDSSSYRVVQFNEDGKKIGEVVQQQDGLKQSPLAACFLQSHNILFVTLCDSDVLKMYELE